MHSPNYILKLILLGLLIVLLILNIADLVNVSNHPYEFPMGGEFFYPNVGHSRQAYFFYSLSFASFVLITIYFLFKGRREIFLLLIILDLAFLLYPVVL